MADERPTAAFVLALIGAIFHAIGGAGVAALSAFLGFVTFGLGFIITALSIVFIILAFLGVYWLYTGNKQLVTYGGVLTLIIAIIAFPTAWGLFIGSILGFIGGILGLVWEPAEAVPQSAPPTPPLTP